jgi:protein TonB
MYASPANGIDQFRAGPSSARTAVLLTIAGLHVGAIAALASVSAWREVTSTAQALEVQIVREAPRPIEPARPLPPPNMRPPEIHLPMPAVVENAITIRMEESKPASPPPPVNVALVGANVMREPTPALQPPRGDIAYLNNPAPSYPAVSKRSREQGRVMLRVRVDEKGNVEDVEVQASSGFSRLDQAALDAVRRWRFQPARLGARAVSGFAIVPINFQLSG